MNREKGMMLVGEGLHSLSNYTVMFFFSPSLVLFCNGATIEAGPLPRLSVC